MNSVLAHVNWPMVNVTPTAHILQVMHSTTAAPAKSATPIAQITVIPDVLFSLISTKYSFVRRSEIHEILTCFGKLFLNQPMPGVENNTIYYYRIQI